MGNWRITIEGTGAHHNGTIKKDVEVRNAPPHDDEVAYVETWVPANPNDANVLWNEFLTKLLAAGHRVGNASFETIGQIEFARAELLGFAK